MKPSPLPVNSILQTWTIGIYFISIIISQSRATRLPLVKQLSISCLTGMNLTSSDGGASNLTINNDDLNNDSIDKDITSINENSVKNNQSEVEKSRISWFPGGLHEFNNRIMSEINDAEGGASEGSLADENDSDDEESIDVDRDNQLINQSNAKESNGDIDRSEDSRGDFKESSREMEENEVESNRSGQRGGALVKEAKKRFQFLEPLETGKVASAASRLINDNPGEGNDERSNVVVAQEISVEVVPHVEMLQSNRESLLDIDLDRESSSLNIASSEVKNMTGSDAKSKVAVDDPLARPHGSHSVFRGIRKRAAKLTHVHGFFSRKYYVLDRGATYLGNSTIQHKGELIDALSKGSNNDETRVMDGIENTSNQTVTTFKSEVVENIQSAAESQGKEKPNESNLNAAKRMEGVDIDEKESKLDFIEATENHSEDERLIHQDADLILAHHAPTDTIAVKAQPEIWPYQQSLYESAGMWGTIDAILTFGLATRHPSLRTSHYLRGVRKVAAKYTGLHGILSGKNHTVEETTASESEKEQIGMVRRRLAAIERARKRIPDGSFGIFGRRNLQNAFDSQMKKSAQEAMLQRKKMERVKEIDKLFAEYQQRIMDLVCEKDMLQRRPNPLWNYTSQEESVTIEKNISESSPISMIASRRFNFPPQDLVDNYLEVLFLSERLVKLNHTDLWRDSDDDDDDEDLSEDFARVKRERKNNAGGRTSGNWLLRNGLGQKIGEAAEMAAYKSVCKALMSVLARSISSIHGLNVMKYSDIRLSMEHTPGLPPLLAGMIPGSDPSADYATRALEGVMFRGAKKNKRKRRLHRRKPDFDFLQRGAIVETLLSDAQISAPLLQLFPLAWQRELLGNIITMATTIISDFSEGLEFHILGHRLSFSFVPITEDDMLRGIASDGFNRKRPDPEQYEAAIRATADDLSNELKFLDKWHERALGSDMLRSQIANLIARLVIHLVDDLLRGARLDLWASHGGPRLVAGLEFRSTDSDVKESAR